jgi:hypothetical protein
MKYILGLNFFNSDVALTRRQMDAAKAGLPAKSIISFEIGNEVGCCRHSSSSSSFNFVVSTTAAAAAEM